jgi:hypothetical protein
MKQSSVGLLLAILLVLGLAACRLPGDDTGLTDGIGVLNNTDLKLHFTIWADGKTWDLGTIDRHQSGLLIPASNYDRRLTNNCTESSLIAYAPDGSEFARHAPPLCSSSLVVWVIDQPAPSPS